MNKNVWGVYKYQLRYCKMARKLISFVQKHPDKTMLSYQIDRRYYTKGHLLFDLDNIDFYLYYLNDDEAIYNEIHADNLLNDWSDSDSYELSDETIAEFKASTNETMCLLSNILVVNDGFEKLVYKED